MFFLIENEGGDSNPRYLLYKQLVELEEKILNHYSKFHKNMGYIILNRTKCLYNIMFLLENEDVKVFEPRIILCFETKDYAKLKNLIFNIKEMI